MCLGYSSCESICISDHKPVSCIFDVAIEKNLIPEDGVRRSLIMTKRAKNKVYFYGNRYFDAGTHIFPQENEGVKQCSVSLSNVFVNLWSLDTITEGSDNEDEHRQNSIRSRSTSGAKSRCEDGMYANIFSIKLPWLSVFLP